MKGARRYKGACPGLQISHADSEVLLPIECERHTGSRHILQAIADTFYRVADTFYR